MFREDGGLKSWIFGQKRSCVLLFLVQSTMVNHHEKPHYLGEDVWELSPSIFTANRSVWLGGDGTAVKSNMASGKITESV